MINFNSHNIFLIKQKENNDFVWYKFEVEFESKECFIDKLGRKTHIWKPHFGVIKFQKTGKLEETKYEVIKSETDAIFFKLTDKNWKRIIWGCLYALMKCKRQNKYPEKIGYQCG